jgi:hypothetical protein
LLVVDALAPPGGLVPGPRGKTVWATVQAAG